MKIRSIEMLCNDIESQIDFFQNKMGFEVELGKGSFHFIAGFTRISFIKSDKYKRYHYCFLIPCNKLAEAKLWCKKADIPLIIIDGKDEQRFESWNANSIYFYDGDGNIAEFIVRHNLQNDSNNDFDSTEIICLNEIGMPVIDIGMTQEYLSSKTTIEPWKGDTTRFGTQGDENGIFLQVNPQIKEIWFPTNDRIEMAPFKVNVKIESRRFDICYENGEVSVS